MEQRYQGRHAELDITEAVGDPQEDPDRPDDDQDDRLADQVGAHDGPDGRQAALFGDRSELRLECRRDFAKLTFRRDLGVPGRGRWRGGWRGAR